MRNIDSRGIAQQLAARLPYLPGQWRSERPLADLNLDSLDTVELLMVLDELYGVRLTSEDLQAAATIGQFCELVAQRAVQPAATSVPCPASE
jgi:acyl carrier protein